MTRTRALFPLPPSPQTISRKEELQERANLEEKTSKRTMSLNTPYFAAFHPCGPGRHASELPGPWSRGEPRRGVPGRLSGARGAQAAEVCWARRVHGAAPGLGSAAAAGGRNHAPSRGPGPTALTSSQTSPRSKGGALLPVHRLPAPELPPPRGLGRRAQEACSEHTPTLLIYLLAFISALLKF